MESTGLKPNNDTDETAAYLDVPPGTLRWWRHKNRGPVYVKLCGKVRYTREDILAFVEAGRRRGTREPVTLPAATPDQGHAA